MNESTELTVDLYDEGIQLSYELSERLVSISTQQSTHLVNTNTAVKKQFGYLADYAARIGCLCSLKTEDQLSSTEEVVKALIKAIFLANLLSRTAKLTTELIELIDRLQTFKEKVSNKSKKDEVIKKSPGFIQSN